MAIAPADFTPRWLAGLGGELSVGCSGPCRELRMIPLEGPRLAKRLDQRIADLRFRCAKCRGPGTVAITWLDSEGRWRFDYTTGRKTAREDNPSFYRR